MYHIGIDPDLHCTGIAVIDAEGKCIAAGKAAIKRSLTGRDACLAMTREIQLVMTDLLPQIGLAGWTITVEGQEIYRGKSKTINPRAIMLLATIAGAGLTLPAVERYFPSPQEWKGSVPKSVHQARVLSRQAWEVVTNGEYCYPKHLPFDLSKGDWKHVTDAIGLAEHGREQWERSVKRAQQSAPFEP
jgi:hypothetical protein